MKICKKKLDKELNPDYSYFDKEITWIEDS